ncbi:MAG TPA: hypothetical protein PKD34_03280, partial [Candidatus Doudnabacteria bacterium]|nr:hypothetical protein [Candidatus Doudnabacteria bacterium]
MANEINNTGSDEIGFNTVFKLLVIVAALFALLYVALLLSQESKERTGSEQSTNQGSESTRVVTKDISPEILPTGFPENFPVEDGATIIENNVVNVNNQGDQSTRSFNSSQGMTANYTLYLNYLRNNGWDVISQTNETTHKMLLGKNGYQLLQITINPGETGATSNVRATLTEI